MSLRRKPISKPVVSMKVCTVCVLADKVLEFAFCVTSCSGQLWEVDLDSCYNLRRSLLQSILRTLAVKNVISPPVQSL